MKPPGFEVEEGQGVILSGTVSYEGDSTGTVRVDFLRPPGKGQLPGAVHTLALDAPGDWTVEAPKDFGELIIVSFIDVNNDGPSRGEPKVVLDPPMKVEGEPVTGIELTIQDDWDEKHPPPAGRAGQPRDKLQGGEPPPDGAMLPPKPGDGPMPAGAASPGGETAPAEPAAEGEQPA